MRRPDTYDPTYPPVTLAEAKQRLEAYAAANGPGPYYGASLADIIWPGRRFRTQQGAGLAGATMAKRLGYEWTSLRYSWGWMIKGKESE
ncbi:hypothetical protein WJU23_05310 [Prosthecobacter sp. SYSU 5D2]|uniref:hypothetical protein n=1 Tax=Prosthecobacter sp. SYSU 5D2 TaxID=3134134 RepID=UPI0031FED1E6